MTRLIDAGRLKQVIDRNFGNASAAKVMQQIIDEQPTAYDADEKIKQIEALKARPWTDEAAFRAYNLTIQIVRGEYK